MKLFQNAKVQLAREQGAAVIDPAAPVRFVLAFPNTYGVGMASLGFQLVYAMLNNLANASCERAFLPDKAEFKEHVRTNTKLSSLENQTPLSQFDVLAFSISFELDYLHVLQILKLSGIPLRSADRNEYAPIVIAGGPCATFNPEPLAEFIDAFVVGDAEDVLPELTSILEDNAGNFREDVLAVLASIPGVYVPKFYHPEYGDNNELLHVGVEPPAPDKVSRAIASDLSSHPMRSPIRTPDAEFGEIDLVEVSRGCGRHCRFCVAGYMTRPPRPRNVDSITDHVRLGLVGAAVFDHPDAEGICRSIVDSGGEFTVSSIRMETVTPAMAELMVKGGQKTLTIAPEAGSDRLRKVINKCVSEEDIFSAVKTAKLAGISRVKLYFMIGLPTETDEDIEAIVDLTRALVHEFPGVHFQVSASCFVPKPWTPFQWHPMERENVLKKRFSALRQGISSVKGAKFGGESPRLAIVQGYLARGDRRIGELLVGAVENDGDYSAAIRETGIDVDKYLIRPRGRNELFPWDIIDLHVRRDYLWREYEKALKGEATPPCNIGVCKACGACK